MTGRAATVLSRGLAEIGSGLLLSRTVLMSSRTPIRYLVRAQMLVAINQGYISSYFHYNAISGASVTALDQQFSYDELGRLKVVNTRIGNWTFDYDDNGNRMQLSLIAGGSSSVRTRNIESISNRLADISNPASNLTHEET